MSSDEEAQAAIAALNETEQDGRALKVSEANPPKSRGPRGGSGGGRRLAVAVAAADVPAVAAADMAAVAVDVPAVAVAAAAAAAAGKDDVPTKPQSF